MNRTLPIILAVVLIAFVAVGLMGNTSNRPSLSTAEGTVHAFFDRVKAHDINGAYAMTSTNSRPDKDDFQRELMGSNGSLRTFSTLQEIETKVLRENDNEADVRTTTKWSTAVGAMTDTRDVHVVKENGNWRVQYAVTAMPNLPPQVVPVNYLRWDIISGRRSGEDWTEQNAEAPKVRIVSMNATERDGNVIILGEVVNEDTVPGFVNINATLVGKDGKDLAEESSFDKINHTLLPKEVSPFRIDFPKQQLANVKTVRIAPNSLLVPASADPVIGVLNQRLEKDARGRNILKGELVNQSGQTVNIPHVLATYYDNSGKVIWVSDGYVDKALLPQTPVPFAVEVRDDLAGQVQSYRVTVNHYSLNQAGL